MSRDRIRRDAFGAELLIPAEWEEDLDRMDENVPHPDAVW
jgi:hypothetical protein